jgi:hypothetical protein
MGRPDVTAAAWHRRPPLREPRRGVCHRLFETSDADDERDVVVPRHKGLSGKRT